MVSKAISLWNICVRLAANEKRKEEEVLSEVYGKSNPPFRSHTHPPETKLPCLFSET